MSNTHVFSTYMYFYFLLLFNHILKKRNLLAFQVSQWLTGIGLERYSPQFLDSGINGGNLLRLESRELKALGVYGEAKAHLKRKLKELRAQADRERKERKELERLRRKAEKAARKK